MTEGARIKNRLKKKGRKKRKFKKENKPKKWGTKRTYTLERERKAERWRERERNPETQTHRPIEKRKPQAIHPTPSTSASEALWLWELGRWREFVFTLIRLRGLRSFPKGLHEVTCSVCTFPNTREGELLLCAPKVRSWARSFLL